MERRARAHASKRVGRTNTHVYRSSSKFIRSEASPAARGSVQPERGSIGGARRERGGRGASDGPITCPTHFPTLLANVAGVAPSARFPHRALAGGPASPRVNPPLPTPRRARASLPPPSLRSAHAPLLFRIPGPAGLLVARRTPPAHAPPPPRRATGAPLPRDELGGASTEGALAYCAPATRIQSCHALLIRARVASTTRLRELILE